MPTIPCAEENCSSTLIVEAEEDPQIVATKYDWHSFLNIFKPQREFRCKAHGEEFKQHCYNTMRQKQ